MFRLEVATFLSEMKSSPATSSYYLGRHWKRARTKAFWFSDLKPISQLIMATKAIGTGTRNLSLNVPVDEREFYRSLAGPGEHLADVLRRLLAKGAELENAAKVVELKNIRRRYYGTVNTLLAMLSLSALFSGADMRRPARMVRSSTVRISRTRKETV